MGDTPSDTLPATFWVTLAVSLSWSRIYVKVKGENIFPKNYSTQNLHPVMWLALRPNGNNNNKIILMMYKLKITPQHWDPVWLEPVLVLCALSQSADSHVEPSSCVCLEEDVFLSPTPPLTFHHLLLWSPDLERKGVTKTSHLGLSTSPPALHIVWWWVCCKELPRWGCDARSLSAVCTHRGRSKATFPHHKHQLLLAQTHKLP